MDEAILGGGVSLIDTAEQYPIPSGPGNPEGDTERILGRWVRINCSLSPSLATSIPCSLLPPCVHPLPDPACPTLALTRPHRISRHTALSLSLSAAGRRQDST